MAPARMTYVTHKVEPGRARKPCRGNDVTWGALPDRKATTLRAVTDT